jgi:hypothetical protein
MNRRSYKWSIIAALATAAAYVAFTFVMTLSHRPESVVPGIPLAILWALLPSGVLGMHLVRLEARLADLELDRDTQRRIKEASQP